MKSIVDIEDDIYQYLTGTELATSISGVIRAGREIPPNSENEDIRIKALSELDGDIETAYVNVNIYVPDIYNDSENHFEQNRPRLRILASLSKSLLEYHSFDGNYHIESEEQSIDKVRDANKHFINNRVLYKHCKG